MYAKPDRKEQFLELRPLKNPENVIRRFVFTEDQPLIVFALTFRELRELFDEDNHLINFDWIPVVNQGMNLKRTRHGGKHSMQRCL